MAVTFGRIGTTRLSGGAKLVCTPDSQIVAPPAPPDVTPNPTPNWANISYDGFGGVYIANVQQIQGINVPITLEVTRSGTNFILYTRVDNSAPGWTNGGVWTGDITGWTTISTYPYTFSISNNQYVSFGCDPDVVDGTWTITIKNNSDGATTLDTFTATVVVGI